MRRIKNILVVVLILLSSIGYAQLEHIESASTLIGNQIIPSSSVYALQVQDPYYGSLSTDAIKSKLVSVNPSISVYFGVKKDLDSLDIVKYNKVYTSTITLEVTRYKSINDGNTSDPGETETVTLTIDHDNVSNSSQKDFAVYRMPGYHKAKVKILSIVCSKPLNETNLFLNMSFDTERYYDIGSTTLGVSSQLVKYNGLSEEFLSISVGTQYAHELQIDWSICNGLLCNKPVEYELEWTWLDNYGANATTLDKDEVKLTERDFKLNSTRIQTKNNFYRIPLIFGKGYLVYRVRPVGRFLSDTSKIYYGSWTTGASADTFLTVQDWPHTLTIDYPHEGGSKNWQFQTSYAEDGKKKDVISYFDGSLRNRQTVTRTNTNKQSIVGEVIYDTQGRAAIEVLPAPIINSSINYFSDLNKTETGLAVYNHKSFDWDDLSLTDTLCSPIIVPKMNNGAGASKYYSGNNELLSDSDPKRYQNYVPDAKGFPFSQIEYTADNTGRIRRKGGVGLEHQIGLGHEMRYLYSSPKQPELNRLFGSNVGDEKRYKKNTVIDPNEQISISFLDPQGRTIATALTGDATGNLEGLLDEDTDSMHQLTTSNLLVNNAPYVSGVNGVRADGIKLNGVVEVLKDEETTFVYNFSKIPKTFTVPESCAFNKYYPFVYRWSLSLKDDCGEEKFIGNISDIIGTIAPTGLPSADLSSLTLSPVVFEPILRKGTYTLEKNIQIDQNALETYANDYIATIRVNPNPCYPNIGDVSGVSTGDCEVTCRSCEQALVVDNLSGGDIDAFKSLLPINDTGSTTINESELGDIDAADYLNLIAKARNKFVLDRLNEKYALDNYTFSYNSSSILQHVCQVIPCNEDLEDEFELYEDSFKNLFNNSLQGCRDLCNQAIVSCDVNLSLLLSDVSPTGQYGYIENVDGVDTSDGPPQGVDEATGAPITSTTYTATDNYAVSVFNQNNQLNYGGQTTIILPPNSPCLSSDGTTTTTPIISYSSYSWKFPINPFTTHTDRRNKYLDADGNISHVTIKKNGENDYSPPIVCYTEDQSQIILVDEEQDLYEVEPQFLLNVEDFKANWIESWAESLVTYHPEYHYYNFFNGLCEEKSNVPTQVSANTMNSDEFDEYLKSFKNFNTSLLGSNPPIGAYNAGIYNFIFGNGSTTNPLNSDPYYNIDYITESSVLYGIRNDLMHEALTKNFDGMTYDNSGLEIKLNMLQAAIYNVVFSNGLTPVSSYASLLNDSVTNDMLWDQVNLGTLTTSPSNTILTNYQKNRIWETFRDYYISFKNKTKTVTSHIYAKNRNGYNGCIGDTENTNNYETLFVKYNTLTPNNYTAILGQITASPTSPAGESFANNVCDNATIQLFQHRKKRFISADYGYNSGVPDAIAISDAQQDADSGMYNETKKCPRLIETENLLNGLIDYNIMGSTGLASITGTNSVPLSSMPYLSPQLYTSLGGVIPVSGPQNITTSIDSGDNTLLNLNIGENTSGETNTITLKLLVNNYYPPCTTNNATPNWSNYGGTYSIKKFKNISYKNIISVSGSPTLYVFRVVAEIERTGSCELFPEEIIIEGTTRAQVGECEDILSGGLGNSSNAQTEAGSGCANKVRFEKGLVKLMNGLKGGLVGNGNLFNSNITLTTTELDEDSDLVVLTDVYGYSQTILPQLLNDPTYIAHWTGTSSSLKLIVNSSEVMSITINLPTNLKKITGVKIGAVLNTITNTLDFINPNAVIISFLKSDDTIGSVNGSINEIDYGCQCTELQTIEDQADSSFLTLINETWNKHLTSLNNLPNPITPSVPNGYQTTHFSETQQFIPQATGVYNFQTNNNASWYDGNNVFGVYFDLHNLGDTGNICKVYLEIEEVYKTIKSWKHSDLIDKITHFSDFKLLNEVAPGEFNFSIKVHYSPYTLCSDDVNCYDENYDEVLLQPGGSRTEFGTISCVDLVCDDMTLAQQSFQTMISTIMQNYNSNPQMQIEDGAILPGFNELAPFIDVPGDNPSMGIYNVSVTNYNINFSFDENNSCVVNIDFPFSLINNYLLQYDLQGALSFDSNLNNFFWCLPLLNNRDGNKGVTDLFELPCNQIGFPISGSVGCLSIPECATEIVVPCESCVPTPVEGISCSSKWHTFIESMQTQFGMNYLEEPQYQYYVVFTPDYPQPDGTITSNDGIIAADDTNTELEYTPNYILPNNLVLNNSYFCGANYGYISDQYLYYLDKFGIHNPLHPNFITIGQFGSSKLNYGFPQMNEAIDSYYSYFTEGGTKSWIEYVEDIYVVQNSVCPPAPMVSNIEVDEQSILTPCEIYNTNVTATYNSAALEAYFEDKKQKFKEAYLSEALSSITETFTREYSDKEYQYTLYYYDQAGNLIQTVPPEGIHRLENNDAINTAINNDRNHPNLPATLLPKHKMQTQYRYNSLNQLVWQYTPDGGETRFAYDKLGRIIASQNAKQLENSLSIGKKIFSYTRYDKLGRIFEAGEIENTNLNYSITDNGKLILDSPTNYVDVFQEGQITRQVTRTKYDTPFLVSDSYFTNYGSDNSFKRVTAVLSYDTSTSTNEDTTITDDVNYNDGIFYDYDVHGNVKELVHRNTDPGLVSIGKDIKKVTYEYDLISGNVNRVTFQPNKVDQFIHKYEYDADNRITNVQTSKDNVIWEKDANYAYYDHGPLARTEIGDNQVQGLDYVYTLHGWLKAVNSEKLDINSDIGKDGFAVGKDAFGFALNYYKGSTDNLMNTGDYHSRFEDNSFLSLSKPSGLNLEGNINLYNGNIKEMVTSITHHNQSILPSLYNSYRYDQLNRITKYESKQVSQSGVVTGINNSYGATYEYDRNGNLKLLTRTNQTGTPMDVIAYDYNEIVDPSIAGSPLRKINNKLNAVHEPTGVINDTDLGGDYNYTYDEIGQLTRDVSPGNTLDIDWRVDGKVARVIKNATSANSDTITFKYDGLGNRIAKKVQRGNKITTSFYEKDAQGNNLGVYEMVVDPPNATTYKLAENTIYGSSRLGIEQRDLDLLLVTESDTTFVNRTSISNTDSKGITITSTPPTPTEPHGLNFSGGNRTTWQDTISNLNFFPQQGALTEEIEVATHLKFTDESIWSDTKSLLFLQDDSYVNKGSYTEMQYFNSILFLAVNKTADGYIPVIIVDRYFRQHDDERRRRKRYNYYRNYITRTTYTLKVGIPEKEWDYKLLMKLIDPSSSNYRPQLTINGNIYNFKDFNIVNTNPLNGERSYDIRRNRDCSSLLPHGFNEGLNNSLGKLDKFYGHVGNNPIQQISNGIPAEMCDFTYSIDKNLKDIEDPLTTNMFSFDEGVGQPHASMGNSLSMINQYADVNLNVGYTTTYCERPNQDTDGDGFLDFSTDPTKMDNCTYTFNPDQIDSDGDKYGDACDNCKNTPNSAFASDGITLLPQIDTDNDGRGDICDNCDTKPNFDQSDTELAADGTTIVGDGVGDVCDNCKSKINTNQLDANNNGIGDICEGDDQGTGELAEGTTPKVYYRFIGDKRYELSNHLGNVLSVITDRKFGQSLEGTSIFSPDVIANNDYYPFGSLLPGRSDSSQDYRYGFNGMEKDDEIKNGNGNSLDFGARMYDPRVGHFFSSDKLEGKYPMFSPYSAFENSPIFYVDKDGNENIIYIVNVPDGKGKKSMSDKELQKRIDKANSILSSKAEKGGYELKTRYVLYNPDSYLIPGGKRGPLNRRFLDKTDGVILMGNAEDIKSYDLKNKITGFDKEHNSPAPNGWLVYPQPGADNPENTTTGSKRGGQIDTETTDFDEQVYLMLHSAGHMDKREHNIYDGDDHINRGPNIMQSGTEKSFYLMHNPTKRTKDLWSSKLELNSIFKNRMLKNFGDKPASDNYDKNKANSKNQVGPLKEDGTF